MPGISSYGVGRPGGLSDEEDYDDYDYYGDDAFISGGHSGSGGGVMAAVTSSPPQEEWQSRAYGQNDPLVGEMGGDVGMTSLDRLKQAIDKNDGEAVAAVLAEDPDLVKVNMRRINEAATPVASACSLGADEALAALLAGGASMDADPLDGSTPLMAVASASAPPGVDPVDIDRRLTTCARTLIEQCQKEVRIDGRQAQVRHLHQNMLFLGVKNGLTGFWPKNIYSLQSKLLFERSLRFPVCSSLYKIDRGYPG